MCPGDTRRRPGAVSIRSRVSGVRRSAASIQPGSADARGEPRLHTHNRRAGPHIDSAASSSILAIFDTATRKPHRHQSPTLARSSGRA
ncbi:MAG: hypothetical protein R3335_13790 [Anaerolineales bacterium]|nr:hypothetical protein [Anaerolineales bacterium]